MSHAHTRSLLLRLAAFAALAAFTTSATAQEPLAPDLPVVPQLAPPRDGPLLAALPAGAVASLETTGVKTLVAAVRDSDLLRTALQSEQFSEFQATPEFEKLSDGLRLAKFILRMDLWDAGEQLVGGRAALALYPKQDSGDPDLVFLLRPADPEAWAKQRIWTDPLLGLSAKRVERIRFNRGLKVYQTKAKDGASACVALHPHWLAVSTDPKLLERTISLQIEDPAERSRYKLEPSPALSTVPAFAKMAERVGDAHLVRLLVDTATISQATGGRLGLPAKMDNALASFVAGGILELVANSTVGTATLDLRDNGFVLEASVDGDPAKLDERFQVFFNRHPATGTPALPEVPGLIGGFTVHRDIATWYRSRDDLLVASVLPEFDKFEAGVGNLLPGKDVGEDVLPLFGHNLTFVSALQDYAHLEGEPGVKLPAFAFIIDLAEAREGSDLFQLFFQTLLSVLNFEAGKQERQPWLIDLKMHGDVKVSTARYLENPKGDSLPIVFNFLPAAALVGDKYIVSSSLALCENLIDALAKPGADTPLDRNLFFEVRFEALAAILASNASHFEAKRVGEGRTAPQAKADVALFLSLLRGLDSFSTSTSANQDGLAVRLTGKLKLPE